MLWLERRALVAARSAKWDVKHISVLHGWFFEKIGTELEKDHDYFIFSLKMWIKNMTPHKLRLQICATNRISLILLFRRAQKCVFINRLDLIKHLLKRATGLRTHYVASRVSICCCYSHRAIKYQREKALDEKRFSCRKKSRLTAAALQYRAAYVGTEIK